MSQRRSRLRDDEGGESVGEPVRKQIKLDLVTQQLKCEVPARNLTIQDLPDEAIAPILSFFTFNELIQVIPNVCTQWRRASHDPLVWRNKEYCIDVHKSDAEVLAVLPRLPHLRNLEIVRDVEDAVIHAVCDNCPRLITLCIRGLKLISKSLLKKLVMSCRNIKLLSISANLLCDEDNVDTLSQLNHLQTLYVQGDTGKTIHLGQLAKKCPLLSKLYLRLLNQLCTEDLNELIKANCNKFIHLILPWTDNNNRCLTPLLTACTSLTHLEVLIVSKSIHEILQAFTALSHLTNLWSLILKFHQHFVSGENAVAFEYRGHLHLQVLEIFKCNMQDNAVLAICTSFPNIKALNLAFCTGITDGDLKHLCRLNNLETLALTDCGELCGAALLHVSQVRSLRKLLIQKCDLCKLKDGLSSILHMYSLEVLSFAFCQNAGYFHFDWIPVTLRNLRVLNVAHCGLDKSTLEQLKQQMPGLLVYTPEAVNCLGEMRRIMGIYELYEPNFFK